MVWLKSILNTLFDNGVKALKFVGYFCIFSLLAYSVLALILGTNKEKDTRYVAEEYFQVLNDYRIDNNRVPIKWDDLIFEYAVEHSEWMDNNESLEHSRKNYIYEAIMKTSGGHLSMSQYMPEYLIPELDEYDNGKIVERKTYLMIKPWIDSDLHNDILLSQDISVGAIGVSSDYVTFMAR